MPNIAFHYLYRDGANYKNFKTIVFENADDLNIEELKALLKQKLIGEQYFYASDLQLPDLHFGTWDEELDHGFHEFESVEYSDESPNTLLKLGAFIMLVKNTNYNF